jgi:hypothetical protein
MRPADTEDTDGRSDRRPILLVDVDGVLNPYAADVCPDGYREYDFLPRERVFLSDRHGPMLTSLVRYFELVWATAWQDDANRLICPVLHLPVLPVIEFPRVGGGQRLQKLPTVTRAVGDRPCAWIDDEHQPDHHEWARRREAPTLIVDIDPREGLTSEAVQRLAAWGAAVASSAPDC